MTAQEFIKEYDKRYDLFEESKKRVFLMKEKGLWFDIFSALWSEKEIDDKTAEEFMLYALQNKYVRKYFFFKHNVRLSDYTYIFPKSFKLARGY